MSLQLTSIHLDALRHSRLPLTMVDSDAPGVPCTVVDDIKGGWLATEHLVKLGHCRIAFIGDERVGNLGFLSTRRRLLGYRRALDHYGLGYDPALVQLGEHSAAGAASLAAGLLGRSGSPTAIFAASDTQALGVLAAAEKHGRAVPADLSVIGFDDLDSAAQLGLTTVRQPLAESGARGAGRSARSSAACQCGRCGRNYHCRSWPGRARQPRGGPAGPREPALPHPVPSPGWDDPPANRRPLRAHPASARKRRPGRGSGSQR